MRTQILVLALIALICTLPAAAQSKNEVNRMVEAISAAPTADGNTMVTAFFSATANPTRGPVDLSTDVSFLVNGQEVERQHFDIQAYPPQTAAFGCNCPPGKLCVTLEGIPMGCIDPPLLCDPISVFLQDDDLLQVKITPAPKAARDNESGDDIGSVLWSGQAQLSIARPCKGQSSAIGVLSNSCPLR